jgi:hypothetical protein
MPTAFDYLASGIAGVGEGYRAGQETQRALAEAKRKALMDQQELEIKRQLAQSDIAHNTAQDSLVPSQIARYGAETSGLTGQENRAQGEYTQGLEPFQPGAGANVPMNVGGYKFNAPNRMNFLNPLLPKFQESQAEMDRARAMGFSDQEVARIRNQGEMARTRYEYNTPKSSQRSPALQAALDLLGPTTYQEAALSGRTVNDLAMEKMDTFFKYAAGNPQLAKELGIPYVEPGVGTTARRGRTTGR